MVGHQTYNEQVSSTAGLFAIKLLPAVLGWVTVCGQVNCLSI